MFKKYLILAIKKIELGSAVAVRLTKYTGKSKEPIHPKHFLSQKPWFLEYIKQKDVVLDLGSGNGQNSIKAAKIAKKVIGVEYNKSLIKIANNTASNLKIKNISFEEGNLEEELKYKTNSFDVVIFLDVLEHLSNRDLILKEIKRILKAKGKLILGVPNSQTSWKKTLREVGLNSFSDPDHKIEYSKREIEDLLKKHRFNIENFNFGTYDTPLRGLIDIVGGISLGLYKYIYTYRKKISEKHPQEASGFEIIAVK